MVQWEVALIEAPVGSFLKVVRCVDLDALPSVPDHRLMAFLQTMLDRP